jgi:hypothetical protein
VLLVYGLGFVAGGFYYLEQRVSRIKDRFPEMELLSRLVGYTALAIGFLALISLAGHIASTQGKYRLGGLVAVSAGVAFWVHHLYVNWTVRERLRDIFLALCCLALTWLIYLWL